MSPDQDGGAIGTFVLRTRVGDGAEFAGSLSRPDGEPLTFSGLVGFLDTWRRLTTAPDHPKETD